jgi:BASS family bile acid:Na+ symporter
MRPLLASLLNLATLAFAVSSMLSVGLRYTLREITGPPRPNVLLALLANFVLVPILAFLLATMLGLEPEHQIGLILVASAAGAPLAIKLTMMARGKVAFSAGLLVLLLVSTMVYLPLVVPLLAPGADVRAGAIAKPLILSLLLPLVVGLFLKAKNSSRVARLQPVMGKIANIALYTLIALTVVLNLRALLGILGSSAILAAVLFIACAFYMGYALRSIHAKERGEAALVTAQRNYAAAMVVATQAFGQSPDVMTMVVALSVVSMALLFPAARVLGKRAKERAMREPPTTTQ